MKTKWEMMCQVDEVFFEITIYWNMNQLDRRYKVEERAKRRDVITIAKEFKHLEEAEEYFKQLKQEANDYKHYRYLQAS